MTALGTLRAEDARRGVRFERLYAASIDDVWDALTDPDRLARWLAPGTIGSAGERLSLDFGDGGEVTGAVLRREPPSLLELEWRFTGESESVVRFELTPSADGTLLILDHRALAPTHAGGYAAGWHAHLEALRDELEGGSGSWDERFAAVLPEYLEAAATA